MSFFLKAQYQNWTEMKETEQKALKNNARERITLEVYWVYKDCIILLYNNVQPSLLI